MYQRLFMALLFLLLGTLPASSQQQSAGEEMDEKQSSQDIRTRHDIVVVTATKTETRIDDLPVSVQLVPGNEIESKQFNNLNIGEIVRDAPGVSVGHGNRNIPAWIHLRGTGYFIGRTLYMVDEIPLAEPMVSIAVNPANVGSAEVLLGPSSSLYGANASGGVVNVRSLNGRDRTGISLGIGYGPFNTYRPQFSIGQKIGNWDFFGSYNVDTSDGYKNTDLATGVYLMKNGYPSYLNSVNIEDQHYTNHYGYSRIGYRNPNNGIGFTIGAHLFGEDLYGGRSMVYSDGIRVVSTGSFYAPIPRVGTFTFRFGYQSRRSDSVGTRGSVKVANSAINGRYVFSPIDENNSYVYDPTITRRPHSTYTRIPLDFQMDFRPFAGNSITVGFTDLIDQSRSFTYNADRSATLAHTKYGIGQTAVYIQDQIRFLNDKATLIVGMRHDRWNYHDVYDSGSTNQTPPDVRKSATTYRGGFKYRLNDSWGFRTSVGNAFWPGNATWFFQNLSTGNTWREANPQLKPEKTLMVDFGVDYISANGHTQASATPYFGRIRDAMNYVYDQHPTLPGVQVIRTSNSDEVSIKGLELSLRQQIVSDLSGYVHFTLNRSEITRSAKNKGNQLRNAPDYHGGFGIEYDNRRRGFGATFYSRFSDTRYYDDDNTNLDYFFMKEYMTLGAKVRKSVRLNDGNSITFSVGVDNLTNSKYDGEFIYNAPGRFVEMRATYNYRF